MKIVYLITGSGGSFYCGNCYRDMLFLRAIKKTPGMEAKAIPLYLPPDKSNIDPGFDKNVFFGAISMFLREKVGFLRNMPPIFDKLLDSPPLLQIAAKQAGTTRTTGYEELTISMIEGDNAFRKHEMDRLVSYLVNEGKPDIIHLSNALILGIARQLKQRMDVKIVCSLLNEDDWIDDMVEPFRTKAWQMISREAVHVDEFVTPSEYFKNLFIKRTSLGGNNIHVVPLGFDPETHAGITDSPRPPAIGYFSRVNRHNGFDKLAEAFIELRKKNQFSDLMFKICGGYTGDDKPFISEQIEKIRKHGLQKYVKIYPEFQGDMKARFFRDVDIISVPVRKYDGYGLYILEANGAGVPVVQPATGAFPEILKITGGGIIYEPDDTYKLVESLQSLLEDSDLRVSLGKVGAENVRKWFSSEKMAEGLFGVYNNIK